MLHKGPKLMEISIEGASARLTPLVERFASWKVPETFSFHPTPRFNEILASQ
jgi:hypothetical protein